MAQSNPFPLPVHVSGVRGAIRDAKGTVQVRAQGATADEKARYIADLVNLGVTAEEITQREHDLQATIDSALATLKGICKKAQTRAVSKYDILMTADCGIAKCERLRAAVAPFEEVK